VEVVVGGLETYVRARPESVEDLVYHITLAYFKDSSGFWSEAHALAANYFATRPGTHYVLSKYANDSNTPEEVRRFCRIAIL